VYGATWTFTSFIDAKDACKDKGMELAFPENAEQNARMLKDIKASFDTHPNAKKFAHENYVRYFTNLRFYMFLKVLSC